MQYLLIHGSLKVPCCYIHRSIYSWFEIGTRWYCGMMMIYYHHRTSMCSMQFTSHFCSNAQSCQQSRSYLGSQTSPVFHIDFTKNLGKEFHAVIIIHSHELVILLLRYLMTYSLSVDDGGHAIFAFLLRWLHSYLTNTYLSSVLPFTKPSLTLIQVLAIHNTYFVVHWLLLYLQGFNC